MGKADERIARIIAFLMVIIGILCFKYDNVWGILVWAIFVPFAVVEWYLHHEKLEFMINRNMLIGFFLFCLTILLAGVINKDIISVRKGIHYILCAVSWFMGCYLLQNYDVKRSMADGIIFSTLVLCVAGFFFWDDSTPPNMLSIYPQHNSLGMALELIIPFLGAFILETGRKSIKYALSALLALALICLFLSGSRGAILGLGAGIFLAIIVYIAVNKKRVPTKIKLMAVVACTAVLAVSLYAVAGINSNRRSASGGERIMMVEASYNMWKDHKLTGVGMANWAKNYYGDYRPAHQKEQGLNMPHNMFAYYLSTTGIIGLSGYVLYLIYTLAGFVQMIKQGKNWMLFAGMVMFFAFAVHGIVDGTLINARIAKVYYMLFGMSTAYIYRDRVCLRGKPNKS